MNKITGIAIVNMAEGKKIAYTYSVLDESGIIKESNVKRSFIVLDSETLAIIQQLETKVNTNLAATI